MKGKKKNLPQEIISDLNRNTMFNMFGLVNLKRLKSSTGCQIPDEELKSLIQAHFGSEMATGEVEFT